MASAILSPISLSPLAEMVPTCAISFRPLVGAEILFSSSTTNSTALSMPRFSDIGLAPAVTDFRPSRKIACASTVAVVVPSPAWSEVLVATSLTIWAPMFSIASASSISLATVTPSLVMVGDPNFLSRTTFRPLGPRVTFTASASASTPFLSLARASPLYINSFAAIGSPPFGILGLRAGGFQVGPPKPEPRSPMPSPELREDVGRLEDHDLFAVQGDVGAAVLPVEHLVPDLHVHRDP